MRYIPWSELRAWVKTHRAMLGAAGNAAFQLELLRRFAAGAGHPGGGGFLRRMRR